MSLTQEDLLQIRQIVREEVDYVVGEKLRPLEGELKALSNDIKEIYAMLARLNGATITDKAFQKLELEQKLLKLNAELLTAAKQAGIKLPR